MRSLHRQKKIHPDAVSFAIWEIPCKFNNNKNDITKFKQIKKWPFFILKKIIKVNMQTPYH